jgi:hypothetical protein
VRCLRAPALLLAGAWLLLCNFRPARSLNFTPRDVEYPTTVWGYGMDNRLKRILPRYRNPPATPAGSTARSLRTNRRWTCAWRSAFRTPMRSG